MRERATCNRSRHLYFQLMWCTCTRTVFFFFKLSFTKIFLSFFGKQMTRHLRCLKGNCFCCCSYYQMAGATSLFEVPKELDLLYNSTKNFLSVRKRLAFPCLPGTILVHHHLVSSPLPVIFTLPSSGTALRAHLQPMLPTA